MGYSAADSTKQKVTQKERDSESGLDYFLARYYSSAQEGSRARTISEMTRMLATPELEPLCVYTEQSTLLYRSHWKGR